MAKGFANVGYKSPADLALASRQVRAWIEAVGLPKASDVVSRWMRVPAHPIPHFLLQHNVVEWLKWLKDNDVRMINAEIRCLWYSFEREVLPDLTGILAKAGIHLEEPPPCGLLSKEESDKLREEQRPEPLPEPDPVVDPVVVDPVPSVEPPQEATEAPQAQVSMFDAPVPQEEPETPQTAPVAPKEEPAKEATEEELYDDLFG